MRIRAVSPIPPKESMNVEEIARKTLNKRLPGASLAMNTKISDINTDSLIMMEMKLELEDELGIELPDEAVDKIKTVGDFISLVKSCSQGQTAPDDDGRTAKRA